MKYLSLFSGIGGFELGIQQAYEGIKTLQENSNCDRIELCRNNVQNVKQKKTSLSSITQQPTQSGVRNAQEKMLRTEREGIQRSSEKQVVDVERRTGKSITEEEESIAETEDCVCLKCMEKSAPVAENKKKSFSPLNTRMETDIRTEKNMGQGICINSHSKNKTNQNTKFSATTATTQKGDMANAPICIGFSEIDKCATQIYLKHFPNHEPFGDITKVNAAELPNFDCLVGGFPCQAFSIAGKRRGFEDTRGTLFFEIARILRAKKPRLFVLENVKGLLSHDNGQTFRTIITTLTELGYDLQWQVLNSKNHGVPQNRERVFIIGHLRGTRRPQVFPFEGNNGQDIQEGEIREIHEPFPETHRLSDAFRIRGTDGISATLKGLGGGMGAKTGLYAIPVLTPDRPEKRQNGRRFKEDGDPSFTITAQDKHGIYDGMKIRRLTPVECERLQGFPDGWTEGVSDTQRYKTLGNAVTVNVIRDIFTKLTKQTQ